MTCSETNRGNSASSPSAGLLSASHRAPGIWRLPRRLSRVLAGALALVTAGHLPQSSVEAQTTAAQTTAVPNQHCVSTIESHSVPVAADGTYAIANVPVTAGTYRVRVVCQAPDGTTTGSTSAPQVLVPFGSVSIPSLPLFPLTTPQPNSIKLQVISGSLSAVGATVQLEPQVIDPTGFAFDGTQPSTGTTYGTSNPAIATVSASGLVTATGPGNVTITARNDGLAGTVILSSFAQIDSDGDGMPDAYEIANGLNPYDASDANLDPDHDGLTNLQEYQLGTNPHVADTDGDGLNDGDEIKLGTNPLVADTDGDGLSDGDEVRLGTNPLNPDTDGDGIPDGIEVKLGLNPLVADPTTTVVGNVSNPDGTPAVGVNAIVFTYFTALTDSTGAFTLKYVPADLGSIVGSAQEIIAGTVYNGASKAVAPMAGNVTSVGTIQLGQTAGQVGGTVSTPDGKPIGGVLVTVSDGADTRSTTTSAMGLYAVQGLQPGTVNVAVLDPVTSLRSSATGLLTPGAALTLNLQLGSFGTVSGTVRTPAGVPVGAGATVSIAGSLNASTTTDALGHYAFSFVPLGVVRVDATDANGNHGRSSGTVAATAETINLDVQFLGRGTLTGTVSDGTGNPVAGALVQLSNNGTFSQALATTANSLGVYTFTKVFVGPISVSAVSTANATGGTGQATLSSDGQTVTANITLQAVGTIAGTVLHADGKTPVAGASVTLVNTALTATADASGNYSVANVPLGAYTVMAFDPATTDRGQGSAKLTTAGQTVTSNITLQGLGTLTVTVKDGAGNTDAGALVKVDTGGPFNLTASATANASGVATFTQQLAGSLNVSARDPRNNLAGAATATLAAGGSTPVTVMLQAAGTLSGFVYRHDGKTAFAGISVLLDGGAQRTTSGADGSYSFAIVPVGTHTAQVVDLANNTLSSNNNIQVASENQAVTANFVIVALGKVTGSILNFAGPQPYLYTYTGPSPPPNCAVAPGDHQCLGQYQPPVIVTFNSQTPGLGGSYSTSVDPAIGPYSIAQVPTGPYTVTAVQQYSNVYLSGGGSGTLTGDGGTSSTDITLSSTQAPTTQTLTDANGLQYQFHPDGSIDYGSFNVFGGDSATNAGAELLTIAQNGTPTPFTGAPIAGVDASGQISITQTGIDGLNVTRRIYVPSSGYFARYLELLSNPTASDIVVDVNLSTSFRPVITDNPSNPGNLEDTSPTRILLTSSGDTLLDVTNPQTPDHWVTFGGLVDSDPFAPSAQRNVQIGAPPVAEVFSGPSAALQPSTASFMIDPAGTYSKLSYQYSSVKIPAGGTVGILHFVSQENVFAAANASAVRLEQLPPEALTGISPADLGAIGNFAVPSGGVSTLAPLPPLNGQVNGFVYAADGTTAVPGASVTLVSTDPIFSRVVNATADGSGNYNIQGALPGAPVPLENFNVTATHPLTHVVSPSALGSFASGSAATSQDILFSNTGTLTGTISRGPVVLNTAGTVTISSAALAYFIPAYGTTNANVVTFPIRADGTYQLTGAPAGTYQIVASVSNTLLTGTTTATITVGQTTTANITIEPAGSLSGTVTRPDGSLAVGDIVNLRANGQAQLQAQVDTGGHYLFSDVPTGNFTIDAFDPQSNSSATVPVSIGSNTTTTQNLALQSTGTVTGTITANDGSSVANLTVTLGSNTSSNNQTLTTTSNANGAFTFNNVSPGSIVLRTTNAAGLQGSSSGSLPLAGQTAVINLQLVASGNLTGTVFQAGGQTPAAGISVTLSPSPLNGSASTTTDANGKYSYTGVIYGGFTVSATNPANGDFGQSSSQIQANGQNRTVNVTLNGFGNLTVDVVDSSNNVVANAAVSVRTYAAGQTYTATSGSNGVASFTNISAGSFQVTAKDPSTGLSNANSGTLTAGATQTITVTLQAVGTIQGTVYAADGVTPVGGVTVGLGNNYYTYGQGSTTTAANGTYSFQFVPLGFYAVSVSDSNGILRASVHNLNLQTAGATLTQNLTFVGVGKITGLVSNPDGSPAENYTLAVRSLNSSVGTTVSVTTGGDGTFTVNELPVGNFTIVVQGLPSSLAGFTSGTLTGDGSSATANIQIKSSTVTLPETLTDADGFTYNIVSDGTLTPTGGIYGGALSPFYQAHVLTLVDASGSSTTFGNSGSPLTAISSMGGEQVEINNPLIAGLSVTRKIYVPTDGYFARRLEVFTNTSNAPVTVTPSIGGYERYSKFNPHIVTSANGSTVTVGGYPAASLDQKSLWVVSDDDYGSFPYPLTQSALADVAAGPGAPTTLTSVTSNNYTGYPYNGVSYTSETLTFTYQPITVPANGTVSLLYFTAQEATSATGVTAAQRLVQLPAEALTGLSAADLANVVNFVVPQTPLAAAVPPGPGELNGNVYAGDGTTPIPNAIVAAQSTDLLFGSGVSTVADANGAYVTPAFPASAYAVEATDPVTSVISTKVTGNFPASTGSTFTATTQNIFFTGTGIVQFTVNTTGTTTTIKNGTVTLQFPCAGYTRPQFSVAQMASTGPSVLDLATIASLKTGPLGTVGASAVTPNASLQPQSSGGGGGNQPCNGYTGGATVALNANAMATFLTVPGVNNIGYSVAVNTPSAYFYVPSSYGYLSANVAPNQTTQLSVTLPATGSITGTLTNADGSPVVNIQVGAGPADQGNGTYTSTRTDANGNFALSSIGVNTYTVSATDPSDGTVAQQNVTVTQDTTSVVHLVFTSKANVNAILKYYNGNVAAGAYVYISTVSTPAFNYAGTTDGNGNVTFANVPAGAFTVRAYYPGQGFYSTTTSSVTAGTTPPTLALTLPPVGTVSGQVTNPDGSSPGTGGYVSIMDTMGIYSSSASLDSAGNYAFFPVPADRLLNLSSYAPNNYNRAYEAYASNQKVPGDGQTLTVNLRYPGTASVHVTVVNADGSPYTGGGQVTVKNSLQSASAALAADGTATLPNIVEGTLTAYATPYNYTGFALGSSTFTITGANDNGTVQVKITVTPSGTIQGHIYAADGATPINQNAYVLFTDIDTGLTDNAYPDANGAYSFTNVQAGASGFTLSTEFGNLASTAQSFSGSISTANQVVTHDFILAVSAITGHVYLYDGVTPVSGASVYSSQVGNPNAPGYYATTDNNGFYSLSGPTAGQVRLQANDNNDVIGTTTVTLSSDTATVTGADIKLGPVGVVVGTVYDSSSNVVPNATLYISSSGNNNGYSTYVTADQNGVYSASDVPTGTISVSSYIDNANVTGTGVLNNNGDSVTINVGTPPAQQSGSIFGTVYDSNQDPAVGATVTAQPSGGGAAAVTAVTDQNGMYALSGLPAGDLSVSAVLADGVTQVAAVMGSVPDFTAPVEFDLGLNSTGQVGGQVLFTNNRGPEANVNVNLASSGDTSVSYGETTGSDGSFFFGGIAPGTITITVTDQNNNVVATATGTLPYGGNLTLNVSDNSGNSKLAIPALRKPAPGTLTVVASAVPPGPVQHPTMSFARMAGSGHAPPTTANLILARSSGGASMGVIQ